MGELNVYSLEGIFLGFDHQAGISSDPRVDLVYLACAGSEKEGDGLGWERIVLAHGVDVFLRLIKVTSMDDSLGWEEGLAWVTSIPCLAKDFRTISIVSE